ncbi:MAG: hypothetical protein JXR25_14825 [Pontiellaceae bacterium]|nr:hypothetical protein [Pontiellaceae bacterium]MBN2786094.1 hypothetical protein [Pontiellaceae bacterium]
MPAKREYRVKGTNDFLILAAIFFFLGLWAVKDAWFPSEKVLKKHPLEATVAFAAPGTVSEVYVAADDTVGEKAVLAKLRTDRLTAEFDDGVKEYGVAKDEYEALRKQLKNIGTGDATAIKAQLTAAKEHMDRTHEKLQEMRAILDAAELLSPSKGRILEVMIGPHTLVDVLKSRATGTVTAISDLGITVKDSKGNETVHELSEEMVPVVDVKVSVAEGDVIAGQAAFVIDPKDHFYTFNKSLTILSFILFTVFLGIHILAR